jgi:ADP-ribose pyrophosphatase YjhB (NUDIX family)
MGGRDMGTSAQKPHYSRGTFPFAAAANWRFLVRVNAPFQFCPQCGQKTLSSPEPKLIECSACDFHFYRNSAVATAAMIADAEGQVLFTRRAKDPGRGKLGMPGGFVDLGETAEAGLCREVREEIGLELREIRFLMSWPNEYVYRGIVYPTVDFFFTANVPSLSDARALSEVQGLEVRHPAAVKPEELAFESMRRAVHFYVQQR